MQPPPTSGLTTLPDSLPLLVPMNSDFTHYHGFINLNNCCEVNCQVKFTKEGNDLKTMEIIGSPSLQELLSRKPNISGQNYQQILMNRLSKQDQKPIPNLLIEMKNSLEQIQAAVTVVQQNHHLEEESHHVRSGVEISGTFYQHFMKQIDEIGWDKVSDLKVDLSVVTLSITDKKKRDHFVEVKTSNMEMTTAEIPPECQSIIDQELSNIVNSEQEMDTSNDDFHQSKDLLSSKLTLSIIYEKYREMIDKISDFFDVIDDLDANARVLEPEKPTRAHTMRRIVIGNHCSIQIVIDPFKPREKPKDIKYLGSDSVISPLKLKFSQNRNKWSVKKLLRENLETTMELEFPKPSTNSTSGAAEQQDEFSENCGVCYSYRLNMKIPDKVCDNEKCGMPFHSECLIEWLRSIPGTHQSFGTVFGNCPYCSVMLQVSTTNK